MFQQCLIAVCLGSVVFAGVCPADALEPLSQCISLAEQGWGEFGIDAAAHAPGAAGRPLQIGDTQYKDGIGTHASSRLTVDLRGEYSAFDAEIGVQAHPDHDRGTVVFEVWVDEEQRFNSGLMRQSDPPRHVRIPLAGAQEMELVVKDGDDGVECDLANWANAALTRISGAVPQPAQDRVNIAPFARVMTWDAAQTGSHPGRVDELRVEQIFLGDTVAAGAAGAYTAPVDAAGRACIGLQWAENRHLTEAALCPAGDDTPEVFAAAQVQWWVGESEWQGDWKPLRGAMARAGDRWVFSPAREDAWQTKIGVQKIRWVFPATDKPVAIRSFEAYTRSRTAGAEIQIERTGSETGRKGHVAVLNGECLAPVSSERPARFEWRCGEPLRLRLRYLKSRPGHAKSDRAVLQIELEEGTFGVAVEDVLEHGCVYVPDFGVFVRREPDGPRLREHLQTLAERKSILQEVRALPDQRFTQAMEHVHRSVQNNGPTMLSLACDNHKFTVYENGGVLHSHDPEIAPDQDRKEYVYDPEIPVQVGVTLGAGAPRKEARSLEDGWMPILNTSFQGEGVVLRQRVFVAPHDKTAPGPPPGWQNPKPLCVAEYTIENTSAAPAEVSLQMDFRAGKDRKTLLAVRPAARGALVCAEEMLRALVDVSGAPSLNTTSSEGRLGLNGWLAPGAAERCLLYLPGWDMAAAEHASLDGGMRLDEDVRAYWRGVMDSATQVRFPEPPLQHLVYASQVHCLMTARNEMNAACVAPWCGADRYGPLESESQAIILGMALFGHDAFAQRSLDYFIRRYNQDGLLTTGYTLMGVGWHLWTLADYYALYRDKAWLQNVAPRLNKAGQWIARESKKTQRLMADGSKPLEYGLVAPGVAADWSRFAYVTRSQGEYYAGLMGLAESCADINYPGSAGLLADAAAFRANIRRAYAETQARAPVVQLRNGAWIPYCPALLGCFGRVMDIYPNEDGGRSWGKDMSMGAHNLAVLGVLDEDDRRSVEWITNYLEDFWCLQGGMGAYTREETAADWFNLGGFSKVQPYYTRLVEVYARMDDIKPFIRAYFNAIPSLLNTENLNLWEHFGNGGAWNKPHETGWFLAQTRHMLVLERGEELWLAPFVTSHWMREGMTVEVRNAPTRFGETGYAVTSHVDSGYIEADIAPPTRQKPEAIVVRLRHPDGKKMRSVLVNGKPHTDFDAGRECVRLRPDSGPMTVRAQY